MRILCFVSLLSSASALSYDSSSAASNDFQDLVFKDRLFVPYGPDLTAEPEQPSDELWEGYGFGMGAVEHFAYDPYQGYLYTQSEGGPYVAVVDYSSLPASITEYSLDLTEYDSDIKDVAVCPQEGLLFIAATDADLVLMYDTVKRADPARPTLLREINAGALPDNIRVNADCSILAVANENNGNALAEGAVHLVSDFRANGGPVIQKITFEGFSDDYLLGREVHMPLTLKAMEYWDDVSFIRDDVDWSTVRANYNPGIFMQPEFMVFSDDGSQLFVNLQQNSALVRIDVASAEAKAVDGFGLKSWRAGPGIDIVEDDGCDMLVTNPVLYSCRKPDGIATVNIDGTDYVFTADEGSDDDYGLYEEKMDAGDLFNGLVLGQRNFVASPTLFSTTNSAEGETANFNSACEDNGLAWCADGLEITIGSDAVNYDNSSAPVVEKVVALGGRGIGIFSVPSSYDAEIEWVWDSGSQFEVEGCAAFPWSHSGVQDEAFSPIDGPFFILNEDERDDLNEMNDPGFDGCPDAGNGQPGACPISETIDDKALEDGLAPEAVTIAAACDRLYAISCGENNGDCFLYDISQVGNGQRPTLKKVFNLSPASENKSPGVAYADRTLGDLDAEVTLFVPAVESPTGKAAIMFGGAHSGTLSFWEFECQNSVEPVTTVFVGASDARGGDQGGDNGSSGLSGGAKAGIAIGCIAGAAILGFVGYKAYKSRQSGAIEMDSGKSGNGIS